MRTQQLDFAIDLAPLSEGSITKQSLINGKVTEVTVHFPSGCQKLAGLKVFVGSELLFPDKDYFRGENMTQPFKVNKDISTSQPVTVLFINNDGVFNHKPSATLTVTAGEE